MERFESSKSSFKLSEAEEKYHEKVVHDPIDPADFKTYDPEMIKKDLAKVEEKRALFERQMSPEEKESKRLAEVFEHLLGELVELENWMGEEAKTYQASEYDDYFNGIDMITEFDQTSQLGMAIDVTFGGQESVINKMLRIRDEIKAGQLGQIKYFKTDTYQGMLSNVPKVIIAADRKIIDELVELKLDLAHYRLNKKSEKAKETQKKLEMHPFQIELLKQILVQVETYANYARQIGKINIAAAYERMIKNVSQIMDNKDELLYSDAYIRRDKKCLATVEYGLANTFKKTA